MRGSWLGLAGSRLLLASRVAAVVLFACSARAEVTGPAECRALPTCKGCGCRGGTGYRAPDKHCVGFREFVRTCGSEAANICTFENAPNTGLNRPCVQMNKRDADVLLPR